LAESIGIPTLTVFPDLVTASATLIAGTALAMPQETPRAQSASRTAKVTLFATEAPRIDKDPTPSIAGAAQNPQVTRQVQFTVSGKIFTAIQRSSGAFLLNQKTFSAGGREIAVEGIALSAFGSGIVVDYSYSGMPIPGANPSSSGEQGVKASKNTATRCITGTRNWILMSMLLSLTQIL